MTSKITYEYYNKAFDEYVSKLSANDSLHINKKMGNTVSWY